MSNEVLCALKMRDSNKLGFLTWLSLLSDSSLKVNKCTSIAKFRLLVDQFITGKSSDDLSKDHVDDALSALMMCFPANRYSNLKGSYSASKNRDKFGTSSMTLSSKNISRIQDYVKLWSVNSSDCAISKILDIVDKQTNSGKA